MKYHIHHGPYGSRGEARPIEYRDDQNQIIASFFVSPAWAASPATDWINLYSQPHKPHTKHIPHVDGRAQAICLAHLSNVGFTEHDSDRDTWDHHAYND